MPFAEGASCSLCAGQGARARSHHTEVTHGTQAATVARAPRPHAAFAHGAACAGEQGTARGERGRGGTGRDGRLVGAGQGESGAVGPAAQLAEARTGSRACCWISPLNPQYKAHNTV